MDDGAITVSHAPCHLYGGDLNLGNKDLRFLHVALALGVPLDRLRQALAHRGVRRYELRLLLAGQVEVLDDALLRARVVVGGGGTLFDTPAQHNIQVDECARLRLASRSIHEFRSA